MPKYRIDWTEEYWYTMEVEADSLEDAREKFHQSDYDFGDAESLGSELQDSVTVEEVEEV
jgi:hypothetical protein